MLSGILATTANHRPPFVTAGLRGTPSGRRSRTAARVETITFVWLLSDRAAADQWSNPHDYADCFIDDTVVVTCDAQAHALNSLENSDGRFDLKQSCVLKIPAMGELR